MDWFIQYRSGETDNVARHNSLDGAIESACKLLDDGCDVFSIGYQTIDNAVSKQDIESVYSIWVSAKGTFTTAY
jgi:hypothetical protein